MDQNSQNIVSITQEPLGQLKILMLFLSSLTIYFTNTYIIFFQKGVDSFEKEHKIC